MIFSLRSFNRFLAEFVWPVVSIFFLSFAAYRAVIGGEVETGFPAYSFYNSEEMTVLLAAIGGCSLLAWWFIEVVQKFRRSR